MTVSVLTPAKINLGLEVLRKRDDGFHDIATVFQTVSVFDRMRISPSKADTVQIINRIEQIDANLVSRTLELARSQGVTDRYWRVDLEKRIPLSAGLGGASADAAGLLVALVACGNIPTDSLSALALELGSDVPFLLRGGAALGRGRGELLEVLPSLSESWLVLAAPSIELERKTAQLYGALRSEDFSDGSRIERVASSLEAGRRPNIDDLANAFERPLAELLPEIALLRAALLVAGAPFVALSGAGPAHYTIVPELRSALEIVNRLGTERPFPMRILVARPVGCGPLIRGEKTIESFETL